MDVYWFACHIMKEILAVRNLEWEFRKSTLKDIFSFKGYGP